MCLGADEAMENPQLFNETVDFRPFSDYLRPPIELPISIIIFLSFQASI